MEWGDIRMSDDLTQEERAAIANFTRPVAKIPRGATTEPLYAHNGRVNRIVGYELFVPGAVPKVVYFDKPRSMAVKRKKRKKLR